MKTYELQSASWDVRDVAKIVFRRWWVLPPVLAACLAATLVAKMILTPKYEAAIRFMVTGVPKLDSPFYEPIPPMRVVYHALTYGEVVKSQDILREVVLALGLQDRDEAQYFSALKNYVFKALDVAMDAFDAGLAFADRLLGLESGPKRPSDPVMAAVESLAKNVHVESVDKSDILNVTIRDYDPDTAARIGNSLAYAYALSALRQQAVEISVKHGPRHPLSLRLNREIDRVGRALASYVATGQPTPDGVLDVGYAKLVQSAHAPTKQATPNKRLLWIAGALGGLLGGIFLMFFLEHIDPNYRDAAELKRDLGVPLIGSVPRRLLLRRDREGQEAGLEALMPLAHQIQALRRHSGARTLYLCATEATEENARLAQGLALCLSRINDGPKAKKRQVLLVDQNQKQGASVADFVEGKANADELFRDLDDLLTVAAVETNGLRNGLGFGEEGYRSFMTSATSQFDTVLVLGDQSRADSLALNAACDATILIVDERRTRKKALASLMDALETNRVKLLGAILNNRSQPLPGFLYRSV